MEDGYYSRRRKREERRRRREEILKKWERLGKKIGDAVFGGAPHHRREYGPVVAIHKGRKIERWREELIVHLREGIDYEIRKG